jgi:malonyl-CoA O-methyltransferase
MKTLSRMTQEKYQKIAGCYDQYAMIPELMGERLLEKLTYIKLNPSILLDLGTGTGTLLARLKKRYPKALSLGADISLAMLSQAQRKQAFLSRFHLIAADICYLPFLTHSLDLVVLNCVYPWIADPLFSFKEIARVLKPEGLLLFSTVGPDTLQELKHAYQDIDAFDHINSFIDMHDLADMMLSVGLLDPVVDMEKITDNYHSVEQILRDLKCLGSFIVSNNVEPSCRTAHRFNQLSNAYSQVDHLYPVTVEIIYGHAFGHAISKTVSAKEGVATISLDKISFMKK